jgi:hypothetical protein
MKKFARKSLLFTLFFTFFFVLINSIYLGVIALTDWDFMKRLESLRFTNPDFELLVVGNSFPEYGVDAEFLTSQGIKSYNLGIVGSSDETSYIQLNEYLTKYTKKPKYVLLGVNSYLDPFNNVGIEPIVEFTMKGHKYGFNDVPLMKFKWLGVEIVKKIFSSKHRNARLSYGQVKFQKATTDNTSFNEINLDIKKVESSYWIGEFVKLCAQNGIKLIITEMPGLKETQNLSEVGPFPLKFKNGYSATMYNFNSRDFCKIFDINKDWVGRSHLNETGAAKFTKELLYYIKRDI